jgi:hypothetical protein
MKSLVLLILTPFYIFPDTIISQLFLEGYTYAYVYLPLVCKLAGEDKKPFGRKFPKGFIIVTRSSRYWPDHASLHWQKEVGQNASQLGKGA